jgi:DNA (cytosine-5)-methyltransferase 1
VSDIAFAQGRNNGGENVLAYTTKMHNTQSNQAGKVYEEYSTSLDANSPPPALLTAMAVRRVTPVECERLQGFPDNYTNIPWRKKDESPDGPRYKALGNSWAVPVVAWIGKRIQENLK